MTDRDVVERVAALWRRAVFPVAPRQQHYRTPYITVIKGSSAVRFMQNVHSEMSVSRRAQIDSALASWHGRPAGRRSRSPVTERAEHECDAGCSLAWIAGLLEGEGAFHATRIDGHSYPVIELKMCDEDVVARAGAVLGATRISVRKPTHIGWSDTYVAKISGRPAARWMKVLRPLMGLRRGATIDAVLASYRPIQLETAPIRCVVPGCHESHRGRGLCHKHYMAWWRDVARGRTPRVTPLR